MTFRAAMTLRKARTSHVSFSNSPRSHFRFNHRLYSNHFHKIHHIQTTIREAEHAMKLRRSPNPRKMRANRLAFKRILLGLSMVVLFPSWMIFASIFHPGSYKDSTILTLLICAYLAGLSTVVASYVAWIRDTKKANKCRECGKQFCGGGFCPHCWILQTLLGATPFVFNYTVAIPRSDGNRNASIGGNEWFRSPKFWLKLAAILLTMISTALLTSGPRKITCQECDMVEVIDKAHCPSCGIAEPWGG